GIWSRAFDTSLAAQLPTGRILYTTQVKLSAYPASTIYNKAAVIMGFYEGMKMMVTTTGQVIVAGQRGTPTANAWYGPRTVAGAVPLNRWVTLAVGTDQATGEFYAWIDGLPQRLYSATTVAGTKIRVATSQFGLGADLTDGQKFEGQIGEAKVWNNFIYGPGLTVGLDPTIEK
ncbi:MAG: Concanavalin A-like lectin/glucanase superfamily, partial [Fibrobacterota bacterium]